MKVFEGIGVFVLGIIIAYMATFLNGNGNNETALFIVRLIFAVCYLAGVVWVSASRIVEAIEKSNKKSDKNNAES